MSQTRIMSFAVVIIVALMVFITIRYAKDSYKLIPISTSQPLASSSAEELGDWYKFDDPTEKFSVLLPLLPQQASQEVTDPITQTTRRYEMYVTQMNDGSLFMISLISGDIASDQNAKVQLLNEMMQDMVNANPNNKLTNSSPSFYRDMPALDFTIQNDLKTIKTKAFAGNGTLYVLSGIFVKGSSYEGQYDYFINSFDLKGSAPDATDQKK